MALWRSGCGPDSHSARLGSHVGVNGAAESQHHPFLGQSLANLGPMLRHVGAELGPRWVFLGASWAMLRHFGALREAPGRHLEAKVGLGSTDLELTCGETTTCRNLQQSLKNNVCSMVFFKFLACGLLATYKIQVSSKLWICLNMPSRNCPEGSKLPQHGPRCTQGYTF